MGLGNALGPSQVNVQPAIAVAGDFASTNPRFNYLAGPGGLVAGAAGLTIGLFAWVTAYPVDSDGTPAWATNSGAGPVAGFVHREQQALNTVYLSDAGMTIPAGFECGLMTGGDYFVVNSGTTVAQVGQKCYANFANGKATFAATGSPSNNGTSTASTIAAGTNSFMGSIAGNVLTITGAVTGTLPIGTIISGTGVATGTQIVQQLTGTTGAAGTYAVSIGEQTVASTAISGTYGLLTIGGTVAGTFAVGDTVTGSGVTAGTQITALGTGTGAAGTYYVNLTQTVGSEAINVSSNVETKWIAMSTGLTGELVKISSHPLG